jgi:Capsule assembly protein Wzi
MRFYLPIVVFLLLSEPIMAQLPDSLRKAGAVRGAVEVGGMGSSVAQTPFWLRTNQYGVVPLGGSVVTARVSVFRDYQYRPVTVPDSGASHRKPGRFDWGFGLNIVANTGPDDRPDYRFNDARQVLWPEVFGKVRFGAVELFAGRRREVYGLGDTTLTSGFVAWSGNAIPFPKIQLHTPGFVPIGGWFRKAVAFRFGYAHGWFTIPTIQGARLHQKYLYVRLGKPAAKLKFTVGLNHQVQWAGQADYLINTTFSTTGQLPDTFRDYLGILFASYPESTTTDRFTEFDGTNRVGNHVGSIDFAFDWTNDRRGWLLYYQHIYEDASGVSFQNMPDGLYGLRWLNRQPNRAGQRVKLVRVVGEFLYTLNQSGDNFDQRTRFQGRDNYFNHGQYREGWSYRERTIGTPLLAPNTTFTAEVNTKIGGGNFSNNRLWMLYAGAELTVGSNIRLTGRLAWSRNFGTMNLPYAPTYQQLSAALTGQGRLPRLPNVWLSGSLALDRGELYPDNVGGFLSLQKRW